MAAEPSPLPSLLVLVPLAGALLIGLAGLLERVGRLSASAFLRTARIAAAVACATELVFAIAALKGPVLTHRLALSFGPSSYVLTADGIARVLVLVTAGTLALAIGAALLGRTGAPALRAVLPADLALFLLSAAGAQLLVLARDLGLVWLGWLVLLVPAALLLARWGGAQRQEAALRMLLATVIGAIALAIAFAWIARHGPAPDDPATLSLDLLTKRLQSSSWSELQPHKHGSPWVPWSFVLVACALFLPLVPLHTWLPEAHAEAPTPVSILLAGLPTKAGLVVLLRVAFALFPEQTHEAAPALAALGALTITWAALATLGQQDLKRILAYGSIARGGLALTALASLTPQGAQGALVLVVADALVTALLALSIGALSERAHHRHVEGFGGLVLQLPEYGALASVAWLASLGMPGLVTGVGELLGVVGAFAPFPRIATGAAVGVALLAASQLWTLQRVLFGPVNERYKRLTDLTGAERLLLYPPVVLAVVLGLWPQPLLQVAQEALVQLVGTAAQR